MRIFVCAGTMNFKEKDFCEQARALGKKLAISGHIYIQGGCLEGLMGETLCEFSKYSDKIEFIVPEYYFKKDKLKLSQFKVKNAKLTIVKSEADRLRQIITFDKIIVLPGGNGTLEELLYCNETKRQKEHSADIILVNYQGYYDSVLQQFEKFLKFGYTNNIINFEVVNSVEEIKL